MNKIKIRRSLVILLFLGGTRIRCAHPRQVPVRTGRLGKFFAQITVCMTALNAIETGTSEDHEGEFRLRGNNAGDPVVIQRITGPYGQEDQKE